MIPHLPKVSIGLVTYNRAYVLARAIQSVLNQSFEDFELIISDDNSSDNTSAVVESFLGDKRIRYIKRSGIGMTANFVKTLMDARGEYFVWLCDDDYFSETYVEVCFNFLLTNKDYSSACGKTIFFDSNSVLRRSEVLSLEGADAGQRLLKYFKEVNSNVILYGLMRRNEILDLIYPDTFCADLLWSAQLVSIGKVKIIEDINFFYSINGISESTISLKQYYKTTKGSRRNPYTVLRSELLKLVFSRQAIFSRFSLFKKISLSIRLWLIIRERFIMPPYEARLRGTLRIRTRLRALFG